MKVTLKKITVTFIMVWLMYIALMLCLVSCDITKSAVKSKTETAQKNAVEKTETVITEETRPGGTVKGSILTEANREKDENGHFKALIEVLKNGGATQTIYYKPDGTVDYDCTADEIYSRIEHRLNERDNSVINTTTKAKASEKTEGFDSSVILYGFFGIGLIIAVIAFFGFKYLNKNTQLLTTFLNKQ